jgi:uncharacterized membrane protein
LDQYGNGLVFTPDPFNLVILIGPLLLLAFLGLPASPPATHRSMLPGQNRAINERLEFIKVWFVVGGFLLYIPTNFQIKMLNGWQVPVFMLSVAALLGPVRGILGSFNWRGQRLAWYKWFEPGLCALLVLVVLPTTLYLFSWRLVDLSREKAPYYLQQDELAAMAWLEKPPDGPGIVLASEELGQYLAPRTGQRPFLAHWAMTLDYYQKRDLVAEVLSPATSAERRGAILAEYHVKYLLYGSAEKQAAPELSDPHLRKVFSTAQADIYEMTFGANTGGQG